MAREPYAELVKDARGEWRGCIVARNGRTIMITSESYKRKEACWYALELAQHILNWYEWRIDPRRKVLK